MGVSRVTFGRILLRARAKVAEALVEGKALLVGDRPVELQKRQDDSCPIHGGPRRRGRACKCDDAPGDVFPKDARGDRGCRRFTSTRETGLKEASADRADGNAGEFAPRMAKAAAWGSVVSLGAVGVVDAGAEARPARCLRRARKYPPMALW